MTDNRETDITFVVLGANRNFLGWVWGKDEAEAKLNMMQAGGPRSTFGESVYWIINTRTRTWTATNPPYVIPEEWAKE
jgi:hypothetical protein